MLCAENGKGLQNANTGGTVMPGTPDPTCLQGCCPSSFLVRQSLCKEKAWDLKMDHRIRSHQQHRGKYLIPKWLRPLEHRNSIFK